MTADESPTDPEGPGSGAAVSRRDVLGTLAAAGVAGSLAGCTGSDVEPSGIPIRPTPGWTANYDTYEDINAEASARTPKWITRTSTSLEYVGVEWVDRGNPLSEAEYQRVNGLDDLPAAAHESDGAWKHTFVLSAFAANLAKPEDGEWSTKEQVTGRDLDLKNQFVINASAGGENQPADPDLQGTISDGLYDRLTVDERSAAPVAVSVRRDPSLFSFFDTPALEDALDEADDGSLAAMARPPDGVESANVTRIRRQKEQLESDVALGASLAGLAVTFFGVAAGSATVPVLGWTVSALSALVGIVLTVGSLVVGTIPNLLGGALPQMDTGYTQGVAYRSPQTGDAVGHYVTFDVYVAPHANGAFTVRSAFDTSAFGGNEDARPIWKVALRGRPPGFDPEEFPGTETPEELPPEAALYTAQVVDSNLVDRTDDDSGPVEYVKHPRPKPGIAGPLRNVSPGTPVTYSADGTVLSSRPIDEYRWEVYRHPPSEWARYVEGVFDTGELQDPIEGKEPVETATGKFPEIAYPGPGRYVLVLEAESIDGHVGRTREYVCAGGAIGNYGIAVDEDGADSTPTDAESEPSVLGTLRATATTEDGEPTQPAAVLEYEWTIVGPLPDSLTDALPDDYGPLDLVEQALGVGGNFVTEASGREVTLTTDRFQEGDYLALLTVSDPQGACWTTAFESFELDGPAGVLFRDDWEDGDYTDPEWTVQNPGRTSIENVEAPDGSTRSLRMKDEPGPSSTKTNDFASVEVNVTTAWSEPWTIRGLVRVTQKGGVRVSAGPVRFDILFRDSKSLLNAPGGTRTTEAELTAGRWYIYEIEHTEDGRYNAYRWPYEESKSDGVELSIREGRARSRDAVRLRLDVTDDAIVDHAFIEWRQN